MSYDPFKTKKPRLLNQVRTAIRTKHYSYRTEEAYISWIRQFILFHNKQHPADMSEREVNAFLNYLATQRKVSASTQTQALCAIVFLYRHVLERTRSAPRLDSSKKEKEFAGGFYKRRSRAGTIKYDRDTLAHGKSALWFRAAPYGMYPFEG